MAALSNITCKTCGLKKQVWHGSGDWPPETCGECSQKAADAAKQSELGALAALSVEDAELAAKLAPELSVYDRITLKEMRIKGWFWDIDGWSDDLVRRRLIQKAEDIPGNAYRLTTLGDACVLALREVEKVSPEGQSE